MRVLIAVNTTWNIFNFRQGLVRGLIDAGHEVHVLAPRDEYVARVEALGCQVHHLELAARSTNPLGEWHLMRAFRRHYRQLKPDVVLHYTIKPNIYGSMAARKLGIPAVCNVAGLGTVFGKQNLVTRIAKGLFKSAFRWPVKIFFQNSEDQDLFVTHKLVKAEKTEVLPGSGVDLQRFQPQPRPEGGPLIFLFLGRLLREKGITDYVEAARILRQEGLEAEFHLLGKADPKAKDAISEQELAAWKQEGLIVHRGHSDRVEDELATADAVVLPTYYKEGTPRSLLEAAAMGLPLIATDTAGCRAVVEPGRNGFLCEPQNPVDLAHQMRRLLALSPSERASFGRVARHTAETRFDEQLVVNRYLEALAVLDN